MSGTLRIAPLLAALAAPAALAFQPILPTDNDALFHDQPEKFYMHVDRTFEGKKTTPWEGGAYGFTRNPERIGGRIVMTRFHEGIDIAPVRRDAQGEPLDEVRSIEAGRVVHASHAANDSNYGKYIVVEHDVEGAPVFSLYSHLATVDVEAGQTVKRGDRLGRLGYTGAGLDRRRAHLHLELALLWHDRFETWHPVHFTSPNKHGIFNGMNLMGMDIAAFYLAQHKNPRLTLPEFIRKQDAFFRVRLPDSPHFQLPRRYPWLVNGDPQTARSWVVSFTDAGFPTTIEASPEPCTEPRVERAQRSRFPYGKVTRRLLEGPPGKPQLGPSGRNLVELLTWDPASRPPPES